MKQREIQDESNIIWQCVQAFAGAGDKLAEKASELAESKGTVEVVCTPSGGYQTVRLNLQADWYDKFSDHELLSAISKARKDAQ